MRLNRRTLLFSAAFALLMSLALIIGAYVWLTRPEALRARVLEKLRASGFEQVQVGAVQFSPRSGLIIESVEIGQADEGATQLARVSRAIVQGPWRELLSGSLSGSILRLQGAELNLLGASAMSEADLLHSPLPAWSRVRWQFPIRQDAKLPRVEFDSAVVHIRGIDDGRLQLLERWIVSGVGTPTPEGYSLALRRQRESDAELLRVQFHTDTRTAIADLGWMRIETLADFLPEGLRSLLSPLSASGAMRISRAEFAFPEDQRPVWLSSALTSFALEMRDCALSFPLEDGWPQMTSDKLTPVVQRYAQLSAVNGTLRWQSAAQDPEECSLSLHGRLRTAEVSLSASATPHRLAEAFRRWRGGRKLPLSLDDLENVNISIRDLELPNAEQRQALIDGDALGRTLRDLARKYDAFGRINLALRLPPRAQRGGSASTGSAWQGDIEVLTGTCRYINFPYLFENIHGVLRFADGKTTIEALYGTRGAAKARLTGRVEDTEAWAGFSLQAEATDVPLNGELYGALPAHFRELWGQAAPLGLADVRVNVSRVEGDAQTGPLPVHVHVQSSLAGGSINTGASRLAGVNAVVSIGDGVLTVDPLLGVMDGTLVRAAGWLPYSSENAESKGALPAPPPLESSDVPAARRAPLRVTAFDLPVSFAAPEAASAASLTFDGNIDLRMLWRAGIHEPLPGDLRRVRLKGGVARGPARTLAWRVQDGELTQLADRVLLHHVSADAGPAQMSASGSFGRPVSHRAPLDLSLRLQSTDLPHALADLLPVKQRDWLTVLGLSGAGNVIVHLLDDSAASSGGLPPRVELELESAWLRPDFFPLPMRELRACLRLNGSFYELTQCEAELGPSASVALSGSGVLTDEGPTLQGALSARQVRVDERFVNAAPQALGNVLRALGVRGQFNVTLEKLRTDGQGDWSFQGRAEGVDAVLSAGVQLTKARLTVLSEGTLGATGSVAMRGTFRVENGLLAGVPVDSWSGRFRVDPGSSIVYLDELRGQWCGGQVLGHARYDWARQRYEVSIEVAGANLRELIAAQRGAPAGADRTRSGTLSGRFELSGYADDPGSRVGNGAVALRDVPFRGTPILEPVARSAPHEQVPAKGTPADVEMDIELKGGRFRLSRVDLASEDLRLLGAGSYVMKDGRLDLRLFGAHPRHLPRIAGVTDLLDSAKRNLVQFRITGTVENPKVDVTPLPLLNDALRLLLGPE